MRIKSLYQTNTNKKNQKLMRKFTSSQRKIGPKSSCASGVFISRKQNNQIVQFESSLERDFIFLCEFDNDIIKYVDQPIKIEYKDSKGKKRVYTPDFFIEYRSSQKRSEIIEIKYSNDLSNNLNLYKEKFHQASLYCRKNMLTFRILTEKEIRSEQGFYLKNISFLLKYRETFKKSTDSLDNEAKNIEICLNLIKALRLKNRTSINDLLTTYNSKYTTNKDTLYYIWFLISNNYISCNLKELLNKNSLIWVE